MVTVEAGAPVGLRGWFGGSSRGATPDHVVSSEAVLLSAGFKNVRVVGDREGLRFVEALKTG